jgi:hypothetical protein
MSSGRYMTCDLHDCRKAEYAPDFDPQPSESAERWVTVARHQPDNPVPVSNYCSVLHLLMGEAAAIGLRIEGGVEAEPGPPNVTPLRRRSDA